MHAYADGNKSGIEFEAATLPRWASPGYPP